LDDATKAQLDHGERVTELMKQKQYSPQSIAEMGLLLYAANEGMLEVMLMSLRLVILKPHCCLMHAEHGEFMSQYR